MGKTSTNPFCSKFCYTLQITDSGNFNIPSKVLKYNFYSTKKIQNKGAELGQSQPWLGLGLKIFDLNNSNGV